MMKMADVFALPVHMETASTIEDSRTMTATFCGPNAVRHASAAALAVNSHDALVEALKSIAYLDEHFDADSARTMMDIARGALAKAKGG